MPKTNKRADYERSWSYQELLKQHSLTEYGLWRIRGEDTNCDFGGHHYMPELDLVEGKLDDVINYGIDLPNFWAWGGGGDFTKVKTPIKVDAESTAARVAAKKEVLRLQEELKKAEEKLAGLRGTK